MIDFTKEELIKLRNGIDYLPNSVDISTQYLADCVVLLEKLDKLIDNYCKHESDQGGCGGDSMYTCKKCGQKYYLGDQV